MSPEPLTRDQAISVLLRFAQGAKEKWEIRHSLTVEHEWGWVFTCDIAGGTVPGTFAYAFDKITGQFTPIGTKGLPEALMCLSQWRSDAKDALWGPTHSR